MDRAFNGEFDSVNKEIPYKRINTKISPANKSKSTSMHKEKFAIMKKRSQLESLIPEKEDPMIAKYEFLYLYKWKKNNVALQKHLNFVEAERIRIEREEEEARIKAEIERQRKHDFEVTQKHMQQMFMFRLFFKPLTDIEKDVYEEVYQCELRANESQMFLLSFRELLPHSMIILITILKEGSTIIPNWMYTLEITEKFIKHLDLCAYRTVTMLAENIVEFSKTELFLELMRSVPLPKDERKVFKLLEDVVTPVAINQASPSTNLNAPIRRLYTQRTNLQAESSEYTETYYAEDNMSRYSRMR